MTNEDELLNSFQSQQSSQHQGFTFFDAQPQTTGTTPEEKDLQRLEGDIHSIFESRRLLNKAIATFCAVVGSSAGHSPIRPFRNPGDCQRDYRRHRHRRLFGKCFNQVRIDQADQLLMVSFPGSSSSAGSDRSHVGSVQEIIAVLSWVQYSSRSA
jgi:hypothetical protein